MTITGSQLGKKFDGHWVFKHIAFEIPSGDKLAITGPNGSGKSTLLRIITGSLSPSAGTISYSNTNKEIEFNQAIGAIAFSGPYMELPEEFDVKELLQFHAQFKKPQIPIDEMIERIGYPKAIRKKVGQYSSGMKQRVRLALNLYFESEVIALDEPTANLDEKGIAWYQNEISSFTENKTVIISSNQRYEYAFCQKNIALELV